MYLYSSILVGQSSAFKHKSSGSQSAHYFWRQQFKLYSGRYQHLSPMHRADGLRASELGKVDQQAIIQIYTFE
jgi:hypothetical protein